MAAVVVAAVVVAALVAAPASAADAPPSVVDDQAYPGADQIFADHGIRLLTGDGRIRFTTAPGCDSSPGLLVVERLVGSANVKHCFEVRGPRGFVTLEAPNVFLIHGADRPVVATATYNGESETVTVPPNAYQPIGAGATTHTLVELRVAETTPLPPGTPSAHPFVARIDLAGNACSAVLVAPQWLATAKSCLAANGEVAAGPPAKPVNAVVGRADLNSSGGHRAAVVELVPRVDRDLVLARMATPADGIAPIGLGSSAPAVGDQVHAAGYSRTSGDWTTDRMRVGSYRVAGTADSTLALARADGTATSTCLGDAGGPTFRQVDGRTELLALHSRSWQAGCFGVTTDQDAAVEVRTDDLVGWIGEVVRPRQIGDPTSNLLSDATAAASSSVEDWGWSVRHANDGLREGVGWSSSTAPDPNRPEWVEFTFPGGPRTVNRVDLYPRSDGVHTGTNYPANVVVELWDGGQWHAVVTKQNQPNPGAAPQRFYFPAQPAAKLRVRSDANKMMQLAEVEAFFSENLLADATVSVSSSTENWGWTVRKVNDGRREENGFSSQPVNPPRAEEWVEFRFPGGEQRPVNRVDLYPRSDAGHAGESFPVDVVIEVRAGGAWLPAVTRQNLARPGATPQRFGFPIRVTDRIRVRGVQPGFMQFAEVEAYRSDNLLGDATAAASSTVEDWGWSLRYANDGRRDGVGWSSSTAPDPNRPEWVEFTFPGGPRTVNRVDLYPRSDGVHTGTNYPANVVVELWDGGQWHAVVTRQDQPNPGAAPQRFYFPAQPAAKLRVRSDANKMMQLAEIEAYLL